MKKILIFMNKNLLAPVGGPRGYCNNIYQEAKNDSRTNIFFLDSSKTEQRSNSLNVKSFVYNYLPILFRLMYYQKMFRGNMPNYNSSFFNQYDVVHFHSTEELYKNRKSLENYHGKIVLTSHSPVPSFVEIERDHLSKFEKIFLCGFYKKLEKIDEFAFDRADKIIFPCSFAEEPYYNNWDIYETIHERNKDKYLYLLTGIVDCHPKRSRDAVRQEIDVSRADFLISYVGRHNTTKGYDRLKQIAQKIIADFRDISFVICGKEDPIKGLTDTKQWKEIGWTNDAYSYIASSDVFVLPNKETYFDIIMLEVLALGKVVIAANTGGNKYFHGKSSGIFLYNNIEEAVSIIKKVKLKTSEEISKMGEENRKLFLREFTSAKFYQNYIELIEKI